jgi:choline-sulfatase
VPETATEPNILFLFTDEQRPDWLGPDPEVPVRTPNIERLVDRGTWFRDAVCPSPVCNPSRACLASGYEYDRCGVPGNSVDYPPNRTTYYERLRDEAGYHVMGTGKWDITSGFPLGLSGNRNCEQWGFSDTRFIPAKGQTVRRIIDDPNDEPRDPYTAYLDERGSLDDIVEDYERRRAAGNTTKWIATYPTPLDQEEYYDEWITRAGLDLIDDAPDDEPWFLEVNFQNPHFTWDVTEEMHGWYRDPPVEFPDPVDCDLSVPPGTHQEIRRNYAAMVEHIDRCVGRFLDDLEARGELEDTLIVFSSDHGEMLGDHGQWQKLSPHQASVGVPLVVAGPDVADRDPIDDPVTILDLHATFLDYAGLDAGDVDSRSMRDCLAGGDTPRDVVYSGLGSWRMAYDGRYKLIEGYEPDHRYAGQFEPMAVEPENGRRRRAERPQILHDVPESESENVADENPDIVDRLAVDLDAFIDGRA